MTFFLIFTIILLRETKLGSFNKETVRVEQRFKNADELWADIWTRVFSGHKSGDRYFFRHAILDRGTQFHLCLSK